MATVTWLRASDFATLRNAHYKHPTYESLGPYRFRLKGVEHVLYRP